MYAYVRMGLYVCVCGYDVLYDHVLDWMSVHPSISMHTSSYVCIVNDGSYRACVCVCACVCTCEFV